MKSNTCPKPLRKKQVKCECRLRLVDPGNHSFPETASFREKGQRIPIKPTEDIQSDCSGLWSVRRTSYLHFTVEKIEAR